jgi:hypothetical protein
VISQIFIETAGGRVINIPLSQPDSVAQIRRDFQQLYSCTKEIMQHARELWSQQVSSADLDECNAEQAQTPSLEPRQDALCPLDHVDADQFFDMEYGAFASSTAQTPDGDREIWGGDWSSVLDW